MRRFDPPPEPWLAGHRGVDLAAQVGAPVRAAGAGTVHFAGSVAGRGVVSVAHPNGLRTTYEPLKPSVRTGQAVAAGDQIGKLIAGHAGCPVAACLHWGLRRGEEYLDPLALLGLGRVRLLPLDASAPAVWAAAVPVSVPVESAPAVGGDFRRFAGGRVARPVIHPDSCSAGVAR
ncbi:M23 family metallopeptidase [Phytohabitans sp. LJ34]|uniref:M23 family metallopeptidase n=1 Tax=Phytohabitans sp. LJ34 TaxID=3452217 RepID=UPI003F8ABA70